MSSTLASKSKFPRQCGRPIKACPHCRRKVRLSPLSRRFLRQSHFSATVWTGLFSFVLSLDVCALLTASNNNANVANMNASNRGDLPAPSSRLWQRPASDSGLVDVKLSDNGAQKNHDGWLPLTATVKRRTSKNVRRTSSMPFSSD